jgi:hypothetical protein
MYPVLNVSDLAAIQKLYGRNVYLARAKFTEQRGEKA